MEYELLRERGIWGPEQGCTLDKWMLDMTEGPSRMRKKMMKNDMFYSTYLYMEENNQEGNVSNNCMIFLFFKKRDILNISWIDSLRTI